MATPYPFDNTNNAFFGGVGTAAHYPGTLFGGQYTRPTAFGNNAFENKKKEAFKFILVNLDWYIIII